MWLLVKFLWGSTIGKIFLLIAIASVITALIAVPKLTISLYHTKQKLEETQTKLGEVSEKLADCNITVGALSESNRVMGNSIETANKGVDEWKSQADKKSQAAKEAQAKLKSSEQAFNTEKQSLLAQLPSGDELTDCRALNANLNAEIKLSRPTVH
jgi:peptidoglycan hydrolase CwlO-like protein